MSPVGRQPTNPGAGNGCPICRREGSTGFNWSFAVDGKAGLAVGAIRELRALRRGMLMQCGHCGVRWYLPPASDSIFVVPRRNWELLDEWDRVGFGVPVALRAALASIGGVEKSFWGLTTCEIPCRVTTVDGEDVDLAIVSLQNHPPLEVHRRDTHPVTRVAEVNPSRFALPLAVRTASVRAPERAMAYAPSGVVDADGRKFQINGVADFVDDSGVIGSELRAARLGRGRDVRLPTLNQVMEGTTWFVGDRL